VGAQTRATALALTTGAGGGAGPNLALPWEFGFTVAFNGPPPSADGESFGQIVLGNDDGPRNVLRVYLYGSYATTHKAMIYLLDDRGGNYGALRPFAPGLRRQVKMTWDGARQRAWLDGVQVVSCVARLPGEITLPVVSLEIIGNDSAAGWTLFDFQYALTA
jgi:hypothetical protein